MKPRLVLAALVTPAVVERARREFDAVVAEGNDMTVEQVLQSTKDHQADALLITSSHKLDKPAIERLPAELKVAATSSVGFDHIDVAAARARNLIVTNTPDVLTDCTADLTFMLILNACRRAGEYLDIMRSGWRRRYGQGEMLGVRASGKTIGIIGMGRIGRAVAERARGFGMKVIYSNRKRLPPELELGAEYFADFRDMLPHCEILTLHAPSGPETDRLMNAETFALLPKGAVFVNVARGGLVDEAALVGALRSDRLFAAGLDVFRREPDYDMKLGELPNVFLTPHMGSATVETRNAMGFRALDNIAAVVSGRPPIDPLWR